MKLVFMGSPDFAVPALDALVEAGHEIACVYSQPARPAGRGAKLRSTAVAARAQVLGLPVLTPDRLKGEADRFASFGADAAVVAAYGLLIPKALLALPRHGFLNIHPSALPRWRGAAPVQRAVMAGDRVTDICIMRMEAGLDTGPVLLRHPVDIGAQETAAELEHRAAQIGARMMVEALAQIDTLEATPQRAEGVTYAHKIDKAEARIDWTRDAEALDAHIRGVSPRPGAWTEIGGERLKVLLAEPVAGEGPAGTVLALDTVACGTGALRILRAQRAGKPAMEAETLFNGWPLPIGATLS